MRPLFLVLFLALPLPAAVFVAPEDTKALFQRDQLPLDTDNMRALSSHLTDLARREMDDDAQQFRATAQLLAIATRLDPANRPARDLSRRLAEGEPTEAEGIDLNRSLGRTWYMVDWLLEPEAGAQGQLLGHQLLDALHLIDPRHPTSKRYDAGGEKTRWIGIVESLVRFRDDSPPVPDPPEPKPPPPPVKRPPILLRKASTQTPLYLYDKDLRQRLRIAKVSMEVIRRDDPVPFTFAFTPKFESPLVDSARKSVRSSLERTWPNLPIRSVAILNTSGERYASRNDTAISGPASLLLHAAMTGRELRQDLVFVGDLGIDGSLSRPRQSWDYLRALRLADGGRLLVPPDLQPELRAMIALEDPGFFLRWEVLVVSSLDVAFSLASVGGDPEGLAATSQLFTELREISKGKDVGQLCVNKHVRQRLSNIKSKAPFHFSASMLLIQGDAGERPTRTDREVTARILRSAVEPLTFLTRTPLASLGATRSMATADAARIEVDRFSKYFAPKDLDLHREAVELAHLADSLGRGKRDGTSDSKGNIYYRKLPLTTYHEQLQTRFSAYLKKLAPFTGESLPEP